LLPDVVNQKLILLAITVAVSVAGAWPVIIGVNSRGYGDVYFKYIAWLYSRREIVQYLPRIQPRARRPHDWRSLVYDHFDQTC